MTSKMWVIHNYNDPELYWSNESGYGSYDAATVFDDEERQTYGLPMEGEWEEVI